MISRRARREAAARAAAAQQVPDPRIETIENVFAWLQAASNVFVLGLSVVGWLWLTAQREIAAASAGQEGASITRKTASGAGALADAVPSDSIFASPLLHPLVAASGATLVVIMLATCLLLAPVVNPFYAPPERRLLHGSTTALFGVLAVTTVAVIAGAAR